MDKLKKRKNTQKKTHDVRYLPEVTVTAPKRWFVGYDDNANPIYTTDYTQSQEYLQNQLPVGNTEQNRRRWAFENVGSNRQVRPGLHGDAADLAKAAQLGIGTALTPLAAGPLVEASMPFMETLARPSTTATRIGSKLFPSWSKALPYTEMADRGLMGYLGTKGMYNTGKDWYNGEIPWYQAIPQIGLEGLMMADAAPVVKSAGKAIDWAAREAYAPYDFYRTIQETTPRTTPTYRGFSLNEVQAYTGSPIFEFGQTIRTSPEKAYFMSAPKDVDVLKLRNGQFRHEVVGNEILPSGEVNGKFVSYGEPWQEFALGENSALYEFPVGPRRGPSLMATDWKGRPQKYSVDEIYDYMQQEEALRKELASIKETMGDDFLKQYSTIRKNLINEKYPTLKEHYDTSVYGANQTVIPNERWNFDKFLKTPFWKYSENPISGQVQKELMMRWPEAKPLETPVAEWSISRTAPQITAENAASITPEQWTAAQDAAIARGDMAEAQRLRDLHFKVSAPNSVTHEVFHHGNKKPMNWYTFDPERVGTTDEGYSGAGYYFAPTRPASQYAKEHFSRTLGPHGEQNAGLSGGRYHRYVYLNGETKYKPLVDHNWTTHTDFPFVDNRPIEVVVGDNRQIKLADAVTYDDKGVRIPLGERDNFNIKDIRYGLLPFVGIGTTAVVTSKKSQGGKLNKLKYLRYG